MVMLFGCSSVVVQCVCLGAAVADLLQHDKGQKERTFRCKVGCRMTWSASPQQLLDSLSYAEKSKIRKPKSSTGGDGDFSSMIYSVLNDQHLGWICYINEQVKNEVKQRIMVSERSERVQCDGGWRLGCQQAR